MEEIINQIWDDIEKLGWRGMRWKKEIYLAKVAALKAKEEPKKMMLEDEVIMGYGRTEQPIITFICGECAARFPDRMSLYNHYSEEHQQKNI